MTVKDYKKYLNLSKVFNKTFGTETHMKSSTENVMVKIVDEGMLSATFIISVNFSSEGMWRELRKRWLEEGLASIKRNMDEAAEKYKDLTGETVKFDIIKASVSDSMELTNYSLYNPKKLGYFRVTCNIDVV
jgi:hypothetical protein